MTRTFPQLLTLLGLMACLAALAAAAAAESAPDGFYSLTPNGIAADETAMLLLERSYYSGETIYKGSTGKPLNGACALHCAAVVISNLTGEAVSGQRIAAANNRDIRREASWTPFVSWGKIASAFQVSFHTENMAQYGSNLKNRGVKTAERRLRKAERLAALLGERSPDGGLIVHFNSSGQLNGSGAHRHAVVLMGYVTRDGALVDLLVNDSSLPAPEGVCVRMSASSLPESILGARKAAQARERGDNLTMLLMDYAVSCRWADINEEKP